MIVPPTQSVLETSFATKPTTRQTTRQTTRSTTTTTQRPTTTTKSTTRSTTRATTTRKPTTRPTTRATTRATTTSTTTMPPAPIKIKQNPETACQGKRVSFYHYMHYFYAAIFMQNFSCNFFRSESLLWILQSLVCFMAFAVLITGLSYYLTSDDPFDQKYPRFNPTLDVSQLQEPTSFKEHSVDSCPLLSKIFTLSSADQNEPNIQSVTQR